MRRRKCFFFSAAVLFSLAPAVPSLVYPLELAVSQDATPVSVTVGQIDLTGAGGSDIGESETAADEKTLDLTSPVGNWRIDIGKPIRSGIPTSRYISAVQETETVPDLSPAGWYTRKSQIQTPHFFPEQVKAIIYLYSSSMAEVTRLWA